MELNIETDFVPSNAVEACLLAYARDLEARIGRVEALADDACAQPGTELAPVKAMGGFIRAALTASGES